MSAEERVASVDLRGGKAALLERGWTRHTYEDADGRVCMLGALNVAERGCGFALREFDTPAERFLGRVVNKRLNDAGKSAGVDRSVVPFFNDDPATTFNDVMDVYDFAEKLALIEEEAAAA